MGCGSSKPPDPSVGALMRLVAKVKADEDWRGELPDFGKKYEKVAKKMESLDISGCKLDPVAGATLGAALPLFEELQLLDVSDCGLKTIGIGALSRAIAKLQKSTINHWWLTGNYAESMGSPECTEAVCEALLSVGLQNLTSLNMSDNALGPSGAIKLAEALGKIPREKLKLEELLLADCQLSSTGGGAITNAASKINTLRRLDLFNCMIGDSGVEGLANLLGAADVPLTFLSLQANAITYSGAVQLANGYREGEVSQHLVAFDFSANAIGNECNDGTDALADAFKARPPAKLETLNLAENSLGDGTPTSLLKALGVMAALTWLDLSTNRLKADAGPAIAEGIKTTSQLKILGLNDNEALGDEAMAAIFESATDNLKNLTELHAGKVSLMDTDDGEASPGSKAAMKLLGTGEALSLLDLRSNPKLGSSTCGALRAAIGERTRTVMLPDDDKAHHFSKPLDARKFTYQYVGAKAYVKKDKK